MGFGDMEIFLGGSKNFATITPDSVIDNLPIKVEEPEVNEEESNANAKIKRRRGRPPKIKEPESIACGSNTSTVDGEWVRKDESDVGDGVKVKVECKPEFQGCDADVVTIKEEPMDDSFDESTKNLSRFSSDASDRSTLNIKEEPLDIFHENVSHDLNNEEAKELYVEEINYNIVKKEVQEKNECDNTFINDVEENYSKNDTVKSTGNRHHCPHCEKSYKNKCHLSRHMSYECLMRARVNRSKYKCSDCHMHFKTKYTMERHYANKHLKEGEKSSCDACRKTFRHKKTLDRHLKRFSCNGAPTNTFTCKNCSKEYRHATSVWRHMTYECEKVPRFGCAHCDYMTLQKGNIAKHFRRKHADEQAQTKYGCPKCKRVYKNEFTLKRHVSFECGIEPAFSCELCRFKTKRKFSLDMHIRHKHKLYPR